MFKATYRVIVDAFLRLGRADLAEKVCQLLVDEGTYKLVKLFNDHDTMVDTKARASVMVKLIGG